MLDLIYQLFDFISSLGFIDPEMMLIPFIAMDLGSPGGCIIKLKSSPDSCNIWCVPNDVDIFSASGEVSWDGDQVCQNIPPFNAEIDVNFFTNKDALFEGIELSPIAKSFAYSEYLLVFNPERSINVFDLSLTGCSGNEILTHVSYYEVPSMDFNVNAMDLFHEIGPVPCGIGYYYEQFTDYTVVRLATSKISPGIFSIDLVG